MKNKATKTMIANIANLKRSFIISFYLSIASYKTYTYPVRHFRIPARMNISIRR